VIFVDTLKDKFPDSISTGSNGV